jgi:hypothetical protein
VYRTTPESFYTGLTGVAKTACFLSPIATTTLLAARRVPRLRAAVGAASTVWELSPVASDRSELETFSEGDREKLFITRRHDVRTASDRNQVRRGP